MAVVSLFWNTNMAATTSCAYTIAELINHAYDQGPPSYLEHCKYMTFLYKSLTHMMTFWSQIIFLKANIETELSETNH